MLRQPDCQTCQTAVTFGGEKKKKKKKPSEGCKVASWTHFHSCLHASLCSLFPSYRPQLTGWCNSQQAHSSGSPHLPPLFPLSPLFPPSLSSPLLLPSPNLFSSHLPSPLPFSPICHTVLCHFFFPFTSLLPLFSPLSIAPGSFSLSLPFFPTNQLLAPLPFTQSSHFLFCCFLVTLHFAPFLSSPFLPSSLPPFLSHPSFLFLALFL